jgi:hypothetical protein
MKRLALLLAVVCAASARAEGRVWEVNGVRLEAAQVERLAGDIARQTVAAVQRLPEVALRPEQAPALEAVYRETALDVYGDVVDVVNRTDLSDAQKEALVKERVLAGQDRSSARIARLLSTDQYAAYRAWEARQIAAFRERGLWSQGRSRRRHR